jgi:hypothetical protein
MITVRTSTSTTGEEVDMRTVATAWTDMAWTEMSSPAGRPAA